MTLDRSSFQRFEPGWVWLCGAGPGDPGLLTLLAYHALLEADHIVYDALVDLSVLELARPDAVKEFAGKRGGRPSPKQKDISARLVALAKEGKKVLRLKGGDPFVFGRGGEEALTLVENRIPFRIVPGISAGVGGLAYAGIPLTHRSVNAAVSFVTGHSVSGEMPDSINWHALSIGSPVLVCYMGMKHLPSIVDTLLKAGRPKDQSVAIVSDATTANMRVLETSLQNCVADCESAQMKPPSIVVFGDVVKLRQGLDWLGAMGGRELQPPAD